MNLSRGFVRIGIALAVLWLAYWTLAYTIHPFTSHDPEPASFVIFVTAWRVLAPCFVFAVVLGGWSAAGFRPALKH
jgi:hypothetical protein